MPKIRIKADLIANLLRAYGFLPLGIGLLRCYKDRGNLRVVQIRQY